MTDSQPGRMRPVARDEALRLLGSVPHGRIVFTERALPAVRVVNHVLDDGHVVVRVPAGAAVLRAVGQVVAYQADLVGAGPLLRWSVVVLGVAEVDNAAGELSHIIRIRPELVSGEVLDLGALPAIA